MSDVERVLGQGLETESEGWIYVELPEPEPAGPMNCIIKARVWDFDEQTRYIKDFSIDRGKLDEMGGLWPEGVVPAGPPPPGLLPTPHPARPRTK